MALCDQSHVRPSKKPPVKKTQPWRPQGQERGLCSSPALLLPLWAPQQTPFMGGSFLSPGSPVMFREVQGLRRPCGVYSRYSINVCRMDELLSLLHCKVIFSYPPIPKSRCWETCEAHLCTPVQKALPQPHCFLGGEIRREIQPL